MIERGRAQGRAGTWPEKEAARTRAPVWRAGLPYLGRTVAVRVAIWAAGEAGPGRLFPWLPVAFGVGVVLYFTAEREPAWWAALGVFAASGVAAWRARQRPVAFPLWLALAVAAAGFATATLRTRFLAHPVLRTPADNVALTGFVIAREERERTDRVIVAIRSIEGQRLAEKPHRVRLALKKGTAPPVGAYVTLKARLNPPLQPLRPGGYDFARDLYFQRIGAVGFVRGAIKSEAPPEAPPWSLRVISAIEHVRDKIDRRIRGSVSGDAGAIASALITGRRDAISQPIQEAMYVSSLAHVLSISGYHMATVAGVVFFFLRAGLALSPRLATRRPIKKWAAAAALMAAALYLVLSGAEVATRRAFIMTAIVLIGVMVDRSALTLRTLAVAALAVLLAAPETLMQPSFQMSFAATLALVAVYERDPLLTMTGAHASRTARLALWGVHEILTLALASLTAGLATMPFAAFHFHRLAPYGLLANLAAMPIVSAWVMPSGLLALVALPFGFDGPVWRIMGYGIDWMIAVALWVAHLPGAIGRIPAFGTGPLLVGVAGLVVMTLLRTPLRFSGLMLVLIAGLMAAAAPRPAVLVAAGGDSIAVRGSDGRLQVLSLGRDTFAIRDWLAADGDARPASSAHIGAGFTCDEVGCIAKLDDGKLVAVVKSPAAFADDCRRAILILAQRDAPPHCGTTVIGQRTWRENGALALYRHGDRWELTMARPRTFDRPWAPAAERSGGDRRTMPKSPASGSAIWRLEELDAED